MDWNIRQDNEFIKVVQTVKNLCNDQCFLALHGNLGVGKTTFVKHLGRIWDISDIKSPSFDIVHIHHGLRTLIHMDAYRLKNSDISVFNLDDLCIPPFCVAVEWPEYLPFSFNLHLYFSVQPDGSRYIQLKTV